MIRFFTSRGLLFLVDFSSNSLDTIKDSATTDISHIITVLKQCPSYQIDKNHTNCGLRARLMPILEYIEARLSSNAIAISRSGWATDREAASWASKEEGKTKKKKTFAFTRSAYSDQRLRYGGMIGTESIARDLFTANEWDWTPQDREAITDGFGNWRYT